LFIELFIKQRFKDKRLSKPKNLELAYHMEQIEIRQPKMPAAQSFIQILGTFLAKKFIFTATYFSLKKKTLFDKKTAKPTGITRFSIKKSRLIYQREKSQSVIKLRI